MARHTKRNKDLNIVRRAAELYGCSPDEICQMVGYNPTAWAGFREQASMPEVGYQAVQRLIEQHEREATKHLQEKPRVLVALVETKDDLEMIDNLLKRLDIDRKWFTPNQ